MLLSDDEKDLLSKDYKAFLLKAFMLLDKPPSSRQCAEMLGMSPSACYRMMKMYESERREELPPPKSNSKQEVKAKPKSKTKEPTLTTKLRGVFDNFYREHTEMEFYWNAKEMTAIKSVGDKVKKGMIDKDIIPTDEGIVENFKLLLSIIRDPWILSNLSPSIINSKYNEIRTAYFNSTKGRANGASSGPLQELLNAANATIRKAGS